MQVAVLGAVRVLRDGAPVALGAPKQRAVLAALALHAGRPVSPDALIDLLWGDDAPPAASASLQTYVAGLRRALEPGRAARAASGVLATTPQGYVLDLPAGAVDAVRFAGTVERVHRLLPQAPGSVPRPPDGAGAGMLEDLRADLDTVLGDWSGVPYADLRDADPVVAERVRLAELRAVAVEDRALVRLAQGEHAAVAAELAAFAAEHPLRESLCALRALAHARAGQQHAALELLREMRARLADELGIEPGPALRSLETAVLRQSAELGGGPAVRTVTPAPSRGDGTAVAVLPAPAALRADEPPVGLRGDGPPGGLRADGPPVGVRGDDLPLVGRAAELAALDALLASAEAGRTAVGMLVGEPGIGKSRLLGAAAARAAARGFTVALGRCSQDDGAPPLWPWAAVLRDAGATAMAARLTAPAGGPAGGPGTGPAAMAAGGAWGAADGEAARFALWEDVAAALAEAARRRPLLVLLDDLHWADASSLRLLRHLVGAVPAGRLAIVGARRSLPEPAGALADAGEALARHGAVRLDLAGLAVDDVRSLVRAATGRDPSAPDAARLRERTAGNAFLLTELVRPGAGDTRDPGDAADAVPSAVADVVAARAARLPTATRDLLRTAAVIGRRFDLTALAAAAAMPADAVLDGLDPALAEGLVAEEDADAFRFSHALVRDAVYAALPPTRRAHRHAAVAGVMAAGGDPARAARHWLAAGPAHARRAWQAAAEAARQAAGLYAWDEAGALLAAALKAQAGDRAATGRERYDLLTARIAVCRRSGDLDGLDEAQVAAVREAERLGDVDLMARAAIAAADGAVWHPRAHGAVHPTLVGDLRTALRRLPAADSELRCRVMLALAVELYFADAPREREALVEQGLAVARRLDDPALVVWACTGAFLAVWRPGTAETRWELSGEALAAARRTGDPVHEVTARTLLAFSAQETGRIDAMEEHAGLARAGAQRMRLGAPLVALGWLEVPWLAMRGRFAEAERLFAATVELMGRTTMRQSEESPAGTAMMLRMVSGTVDANSAAYLQALAPASALPLDASIVMLLVRGGRVDEARAWYAARGIGLDTDDWYALFDACQAAEAAAGIGDTELAARAYRWLVPYAGRPCSAGGAVALAPVDAYLALAAAAAGERAVATRHADAATALCERWRIPLMAQWLRGHRERGGF